MGSSSPYYLDTYYVLAHSTRPKTAVNTLLRVDVAKDRIKVVLSDDDPNLAALTGWCVDNGLPTPLVFCREDYLHDPYLSLMSEEMVRKHFPKTDTPARRFLSTYEHRKGPGRYYAVFDDDVTFRWSNLFRKATLDASDFDHRVWERAVQALQLPQVWACCWVNPYTWGPAYYDGADAQVGDFSAWTRKGQSANQSAWVLSSDELHQWYSPIVCDYITSARYAKLGRWAHCLNEYINVHPPNTNGVIWGGGDPSSRANKANQVAALRILGASWRAAGVKPYRKHIRYMYPHLIDEEE